MRIRPRGKHAWRVIVWSILGLSAGYALFGGEYPAQELWRMRQKQARAMAEVSAVQAQVDSLRVERDRLDADLATIERVAREEYGLVREDEVIYRFVDVRISE